MSKIVHTHIVEPHACVKHFILFILKCEYYSVINHSTIFGEIRVLKTLFKI